MPGSPSRGLEQSLAIAPWSLRAVLEGFPYIITSDSEPLLSSSGPLVAERWKFWLSGHPDHVYAQTLDQAITRGVRIGYRGPHLLAINEAHETARMAPDIISSDIQIQLQHRRLRRLAIKPTDHYIASPLGLVPKPNGKYRRIHDLSFPKGTLVNNYMLSEFGALEYAAYEDAVNTILT